MVGVSDARAISIATDSLITFDPLYRPNSFATSVPTTGMALSLTVILKKSEIYGSSTKNIIYYLLVNMIKHNAALSGKFEE
jgi:hypothetical protein